MVNTLIAQKEFLNKLGFKQDTGKIRIDNGNMGSDPKHGEKKKARIQILSRSDFEFT